MANKLPLVGRTRCPSCRTQLRFTDDDYADDIIEKHLTKCWRERV